MLSELVRGQANAHALNLPRNSGKAEAVRQGILWTLEHHPPGWVGYLDADMATPFEELERLALFQESGKVAIWGARLMRIGAQIERSPARHYMGRLAATAISAVLRLPTYDTQCGAKLFQAELASRLFAAPFQSRWLFDVEILARCRDMLGRENFIASALEEPLRKWVEVGGSKIRLRDLLLVPIELWKIHWLYNVRRKSLHSERESLP